MIHKNTNVTAMQAMRDYHPHSFNAQSNIIVFFLTLNLKDELHAITNLECFTYAYCRNLKCCRRYGMTLFCGQKLPEIA